MRRWTYGYWILGCCAVVGLTAGQALAQEQPQQQQQQQEQEQEQEQEQQQPDAERAAEEPETHIGEFVELENGEFKVRVEDEEHSYNVTDQTQVMINGQRGRIEDIREGDQIRVATDEENNALRIEVRREEPRPEAPELRDQPRRDREIDEPPRDLERDPGDRRLDERQLQERQYDERALQDRQLEDRRMQDRRTMRPPMEQAPVELGVLLSPSPTTGVQVQDIRPQSPADLAGLRPGDYILSLDGERIDSLDDFDHVFRQVRPGTRAEMEIWRNEQRQTLMVEFREDHEARFRGAPPRDRQFEREYRDPQVREQGQRERGFGDQEYRDRDFRVQEQRGGERRFREDDQAWIGVMLQETPQQRGVQIAQVYPAGPAARAGLRPGDLVIGVEDREVFRTDDLIEIVGQTRAGQEVNLIVLRDRMEQRVPVRTASRAEFMGHAQRPDHRAFHRGEHAFDDVPDHHMMLEQQRRLAEQHQRIEEQLEQVLHELQTLREEMGANAQRPAQERDR